MEDFKRESWEEFQERIGVNLEREEGEDEDLFWARFIYFNSIYVNEQGLNWRRQILQIKRLLTALQEKAKKDGDSN